MSLRAAIRPSRPLLLAALVVVLLAVLPSSAAAASPERTVRVADAAWLAGRTVDVHTPWGVGVVGVTWSGGPARLELRSRVAAGHWTPWRAIDATAGGDGTTRWGSELPMWVAHATRVQVRLAARNGGAAPARIHDAQVVLIGAATTARDRVEARRAGSSARSESAARRSTLATTMPPIHPRADWGADESLRRANPLYAPTLHGAVVHHTDGSNVYAPADVPSLIRGIYRFHVLSRGWNDIGYDYLVDRYGGVWEGRGGGVEANVVGAHTGGFNTGTTGIAVIGTFTSEPVTPEARTALLDLLSWRLDVAHVDPTAMVRLRSAGNERFPAGTYVTVRTVAGHRDFSSTSCPGGLLYDDVTALGQEAWAAGGVKVAAPRAAVTTSPTGSVASVAFSAVANQQAQFTLDVRRTSDDAPLAHLTGTGSALALTWTPDAGVSVDPADVSWHLEASSDTSTATPFDGPLVGTAAPAKLSLAFVTHPASYLAPNGDGLLDTLPLDLRLGAGAQVQVTAVPAADSTATALLLRAPRYRPPGRSTLAIDGTLADGSALPDGVWVVHVLASAASASPVEVVATVTVDRGVAFGPLPAGISPNGDRRLDAAPVNVATSDPARTVTAELLDGAGRVRATLGAGAVHPGVLALGGTVGAFRVTDGVWRVRVSSASYGGVLQLTRSIRVDRVAPRARAARLANGAVRIRVGEDVLATARPLHHTARYLRLRHGTTVTRAFSSAKTVLLRDDAGNRTTVRIG